MRKIYDSARTAKYLEDPLAAGLFPEMVRDDLVLFEFDSDETIIEAGRSVDYLFLLVEGRPKILAEHVSGKVFLLDFCTYPSVFGEWEMRDNVPTCTIRTITPCLCVGISQETARRKLYDEISFWKTLKLLSGTKTNRQVEHCINTISMKLEARCAYYILNNSFRNQYREPHTEAASYMGVSYRHFLSVLESFVKRGILEKSPAGYRIIDLEALEDLLK